MTIETLSPHIKARLARLSQTCTDELLPCFANPRGALLVEAVTATPARREAFAAYRKLCGPFGITVLSGGVFVAVDKPAATIVKLV